MLETLTQAQEIAEFIVAYGNYTDYDAILEAVNQHLAYGTGMVIRTKVDGSIVAVARWNVIRPDAVHILDVVVRPDYRNSHMLRNMIAFGVSRNPSVKYIVFERGFKYPDKGIKIYPIDYILKRRRTWEALK